MAGEKAEENGIPLLAANGENGVHDKFDDDIEALPLPVVAKPAGIGRQFLIWTAINMAATIGIVFTNKAIFNDPAFKLMQTSFASFHFVCTGLTLWVVSRPSIGAFTAKRAGIVEMLPVSQ
jgi:solute carrier family 35 protein E3